MRSFSDILNEFQRVNLKNVEISLTKKQAEDIFGENIIRKEVGSLVVSIKWQGGFAKVCIMKSQQE